MDDDIAIKVDHVSKVFKLPHERTTSIKSAVVNFYRRDKSYELQRALDDVSFEVKKGEFFGIVGRNGSGKSTMLKILAGIYSPSSGSVHINGKLTPFIELGVGFSPELTGRENVYLNGALLGFSRAEMDELYDEIVAFAELERFMDQKLKNYSSGMQVRLAFSIAIRANTDILVLDEVLAVGDMTFQDKCYEYFEQIKDLNKTVVFVSHDLKSVKRFCDRVVLLDRSKQLDIGETDRMLQQYELLVHEESQRIQYEAEKGQPGYHIGTNEAEVSEVRLNKSSYRSGDDIEVSAKFKLHNAQKSARILFSLFDSQGGKLISADAAVKPKAVDKAQTFQVRLPSPALMPGSYKINIGVFDDDLTTPRSIPRLCPHLHRR